jgi:hypothetical protein
MAIISDGNGGGTVTGTASDDIIYGGNGKDIIDGGAGNDQLFGGNGDDTLKGGAGDDILNGGNGKDTAVYSGPMANYLFELQDDGAIRVFDTTGADGDDLVYDVVNFQFADQTVKAADLTFGTIVTTADYSWTTQGVTVDLVLNSATGPEIGTEVLPNSIVNVIGGSGNDVLRGDAGANTLTGNAGNDFLVGRAGNDTLIGGLGIDIARFFGNRAAYTFAPNTVTGPDGVDTTSGVELLRFDDAYMLGFSNSPINLTGFGLDAGVSLFGRLGNDLLTMGTNANGRLIDLGGGDDTLTLGTANASYSLNLANVEHLVGSFGNETVTLTAPVTNNMSVDLGFGANDVLNLSTGNDTVTVTGVETLFNPGGTDTVTFLHNDISVGQTFNLGFATGNTLILDGSNSNYGLQLFGNMTVIGASDSGDETVNVTNNQAGTTFDLGAGDDTLNLNSSAFPNGVTVANVEHVNAIGSNGDTIVIAGNSGGVTTVTAGGGGDQITASADVDHFRYVVIGDSPYDLPGAGQRDIITGFNADQDKFVFDGIPVTAFSFELTNFAGNDIVRVDFNGDASGETGWDMAIQVNNLTGTLGLDDFILV